jgi:serine protease Do
VVVTKVDPDGIGAERGLQAGDIILDVAGNEVSAPLDVQRALNDAHSRSKRNVVARVKSATLPASLQSLWAKQRG